MACTALVGYHTLYYVPSGATPSTSTHLVGKTGEEGIRLTRDVLIQEITADELGPEAIVDGVYQGANMEMEFVLEEVNVESVQALMHPFQTNAAGTSVEAGHVGVTGTLASGRAGTLFALPVANTPAANQDTGGSLDGYGRIFQGINIGPVVETLDTTPRFIPIRFRCYPYPLYASPSTLVYWEWAAALKVAGTAT